MITKVGGGNKKTIYDNELNREAWGTGKRGEGIIRDKMANRKY